MRSWNRQLLTIADKGWDAFEAGQPIEDCPYHVRTGVSGQRADHWRQGWRLAREKKVELEATDEWTRTRMTAANHMMVLGGMPVVEVPGMPDGAVLIARSENGEIDLTKCAVIKDVKS